MGGRQGIRPEVLEAAKISLRMYGREIETIREAIADGSATPPMLDRLGDLVDKSDEVEALIMRENARVTRNEQVRVGERLKCQAVTDGIATCEGCGWQIPEQFVSRMMHLHHVTPVSLGGDNNPSNLVVICPNCHAIAHEIISGRNLDSPMTREELLTILRREPLKTLQLAGNRRHTRHHRS